MDVAYDAVIIGAGHNGIVAGIYLAGAGWKVLILERNEAPGGSRTHRGGNAPGLQAHLFATNLNLFAGSPFYNEFKTGLHKQGLEFVSSALAFSPAFPVGGDSVCGSHHLYQNYFMRPFPGWSRYKTPIKNLYMVGAATWPGAGVGAGSGRLLGKMLTGR